MKHEKNRKEKKISFWKLKPQGQKRNWACRATSYDGNKTCSVTLNFTTEVPD